MTLLRALLAGTGRQCAGTGFSKHERREYHEVQEVDDTVRIEVVQRIGRLKEVGETGDIQEVDRAIVVDVRVALVTETVAVGIELGRVRYVGAVIRCVCHSIAI